MINTTSTYQHHSKADKSYSLRMMYEKPVVQVSTAVVLTIFAIIFFAIFAIRPTLATIAELIKKIDDQKEVVEKLNKKSSALATAQSEYLLVESKLPLVEAAIPKTHAADLLLKQIEATAAQLQLPIESIQMDSIDMPVDPGNSTIVNDVVQLPVSVTINAPYGSQRDLLALISQLKRFITVESISFTSEDSEEDSENLKMTIQMFAYYLSGTTTAETPNARANEPSSESEELEL